MSKKMANTHAHMTTTPMTTTHLAGLTRRRLLKTGIALSAATVTSAKADLTIGGQVISQPSQRYGLNNDADNMAFGEPNATPMTPQWDFATIKANCEALKGRGVGGATEHQRFSTTIKRFLASSDAEMAHLEWLNVLKDNNPQLAENWASV